MSENKNLSNTHVIFVSDVATIIDQNPYQDSDDCLQKYRKKYLVEQSVISRSELVEQVVAKKMEDSKVNIQTYLNRIRVSNSNQICSELQQVLKKKESDESKHTGPESPDSVKPSEINAFIRSEVYKEHGKKYEMTVFEWLKIQLHGDVAESQMGRGASIGSVGGHDWKIYGKIDGMYTNVLGKRFIIEIKNRQNKIYDQIPIYEQIQIQMYMWIFDIDDAILVQHYVGEYSMKYFKKEKGFIERTVTDLRGALGRMF